MSNRIRPREWNNGRLTRPRAGWKGKKRGDTKSPLSGEMNRITAALSKTLLRSSIIPKVTLPARTGDR